ncbi:hypothetical protein FHS00_003551 [Limimaricola variabilis]|uniref:Uncharacterized protein n=1 Tax=Limimaricola variabilis TaxID=1492771 RepID=A0ABR6HU50_9RHOB|nr:hypothetical protein [Limimaricola variabilis]MBB3713938.1 hypothetical protein [Limimaricola variabilis]
MLVYLSRHKVWKSPMPNAITIINARFESNLSADSDQSRKPAGADAHVAGTEVDWAPTGLPKRRRNVRSWVTFWHDEASASGFLANRHTWIPILSSATKVSAGLLLPYASYGDVNWRGRSPAPIALKHTPKSPELSRVFAITSIGLGGLGPGALAFGQGNYAIRNVIREQSGLEFEAQVLPDDQKLDPLNMSLWSSEEALVNFAYRSEPHRSAMGAKDHPDLLRGSFTRCHVKSFWVE